MYVYVLDSNGVPLMPTNRCGHVRWLLKNNKAIVVKRTPFTIKLLYETGQYVQPVTLGVDAGSKTIGISATTKSKELYSAEVELRLKGGRLKLNQAPYKVFGFRLFDKVRYKGVECFIKGRRTSGSFALRTIDNVKVTDGVSYKKIRFLEPAKSIITQRMVIEWRQTILPQRYK